jgi:hypothetical protein
MFSDWFDYCQFASQGQAFGRLCQELDGVRSKSRLREAEETAREDFANYPNGEYLMVEVFFDSGTKPTLGSRVSSSTWLWRFRGGCDVDA